MKKTLKLCLFPFAVILRAYRNYLRNPKRMGERALRYDRVRFMTYAGALHPTSQRARLAQIIMAYHVIEKGLTMPNRRLDFGHKAILDLMRKVREYGEKFGVNDGQVLHAIGCVKEYYGFHVDSSFDMSADMGYWRDVKSFCDQYASVPRARQIMITREQFYAQNEMPFPAFAKARHTSRHYQGVVPIELLKRAVELAMTAPSACNRQYVRVHCVSNHAIRDQLFELQNGNRGFGGDADKVLVVTSDLSGIRWVEERNDIYTNAGIFIMNLCYALHYSKIAHCILNWSVAPEKDQKARRALGLKESETIIAILTCGNAPHDFQVAVSPRKSIDDVFNVVE